MNGLISIDDVKKRMMIVRGNPALLDRDIAALYGVETREINQALRNNPDKFPPGYVVRLTSEEVKNWRSKILISNLSAAEKSAIKMGVRRAPYAFTEKGVYMLATVLKGERAVRTTIKIIETYSRLRSMVADMESLQRLKTDRRNKPRHSPAPGISLLASLARTFRPTRPKPRSSSTWPFSRLRTR